MNLSALFRVYLLSKSNPASKATVKNYVSDVNRFISWFELNYNQAFNPAYVDQNTISRFKRSSLTNYSASSVERSISSLRKFFAFLKEDNHISQNPFEANQNSFHENTVDPWRIRDFKNYLYLSNVSALTIKNYIMDLNQLRKWLENTSIGFQKPHSEANSLPYNLNSRLINEYKDRLLNVALLSPLSVNRKLSSIRRYINWASDQGIIKSNIQVLNDPKLTLPFIIPVPDEVHEVANGQSSMVNPQWSSLPPIRLIQKSRSGLGIILDAALIIPLASVLSQINQAVWTVRGKPVFDKAATTPQAVKNIPKSFYAPTQISLASYPTHKKVWHKARYSRPEWYKKYHSYTFVTYFHLSLLMLAVIGFSYFLSSYLGSGTKNRASVLGTISSQSPRTLAFHGRITDSNGESIYSRTNLRMAIYNSRASSGSALLWQEVISANPDSAGIFNVLLGLTKPIPAELFLQNPSLYLGITVESTDELSPRQEIPTVELSENSEKLQGLMPITNTSETSNVILALNSSGNLTIGGNASPTFQATGGTFTLSGKTLVLTSTFESNGNVVLNPDGTGVIDLQKRIQNTSNTNSILQGAVVVEDIFLVAGTSSSQAVLNISQGHSGDLIIASVSGSTRFLVDNGGNISTPGSLNGLRVENGAITNATWSADLIKPSFGGTGLNTSSSTGVPYVSNGTWSIDSNSLAPTHGGTGITSYSPGDLIFANTGNSLTRLKIGTAGTCLTSNGASPSWTSCGQLSKWTESMGVLFMNNTISDFIVGGDSTSSAKFAVLNLSGSDVATATVSGNLIVMSENGAGGNAGFGTVNPEARVQISNGGLCVGSDIDCNSDNNSEGVIYAASTATSVYDVAENFPTYDTTLEAGEVVAIDAQRGIFVERNTKANNPQAIGAISGSPGLLLGGFGGDQFEEEKQVAVALSGRILIKASIENGPIRKGDFVTSSEAPGKIMKATDEGAVIGQALEDWNGEKEEVMVFIKATYNDPNSHLARAKQLEITRDSKDNFTLNADGEDVERIGAFSDAFIARIKAGYLELGRLTVGSAKISGAFIGELGVNSLAIATEEVTIAGQSIRDYIYSIVDARISQNKIALASPILETDIIKPNSGKNLVINLPSNDEETRLVITNASGSAVASIDALGNASFSGTITSNGVQASDASISGTLRAGRIIADQIDLSEEVLARLEGIEISSSPAVTNNYISNNYYYSSSDSASFSDPDLASTGDEDIGSLTVGTGTFTTGLISYGTTSFFDVSVADRLFVGSQLSIAERSINVLGANLELQPLRLGGVSFAGGLVEIDSEGNLKVGGNAYFAKNAQVQGKLFAGVIAPIQGNNLIFDFEAENETGKVEFRSGSASAVLTFSSLGDVNASGTGTFNKLNLSFIPKAIAVSDTEIIATGSAGTAEIKPYKNELTIRNPLVTHDSLIYITPKTPTPNQNVYLLRQVPGESFTVGLSKAIAKPVPFNWILIN